MISAQNLPNVFECKPAVTAGTSDCRRNSCVFTLWDVLGDSMKIHRYSLTHSSSHQWIQITSTTNISIHFQEIKHIITAKEHDTFLMRGCCSDHQLRTKLITKQHAWLTSSAKSTSLRRISFQAAISFAQFLLKKSTYRNLCKEPLLFRVQSPITIVVATGCV